MPLIPFPNIPNVPGVPSLVRNATVPSLDAIVQAVVSRIVEAIFGKTIWGVYDKNDNVVLVPETFLGLDYKNGTHVATHPIEDGGFGSYNKVNTPYDCRVQMAIGGDEYSRAQFLVSCDLMLKSIETYSIVTPEKTYLNATLQNYAYRRETRKGVSLLVVDLWFLEIRTNQVGEKKEPASPSAADPISGGQIQTQSYKTTAGVDGPPSWSEWEVI